MEKFALFKISTFESFMLHFIIGVLIAHVGLFFINIAREYDVTSSLGSTAIICALFCLPLLRVIRRKITALSASI